jgi:hypothetical protein
MCICSAIFFINGYTNIRRLIMKKPTSDKSSRNYTIIKVLGIIALIFLMLVSITGCVSFAGIPNVGSNNISNYNKALENDIKIQDKAIELNPQDSTA